MNHPMNSSTPGKLIFDYPNTLVSVCLAAVIFQYFRNHLLRHRRCSCCRSRPSVCSSRSNSGINCRKPRGVTTIPSERRRKPESFLAQSLLIFPERNGLADDFIQLCFGFAAAEGEGAGEMVPIFGRKAVEFAGDGGIGRMLGISSAAVRELRRRYKIVKVAANTQRKKRFLSQMRKLEPGLSSKAAALKLGVSQALALDRKST